MSDAGQTPDTIVSFDNVGLRYGTDTEVLRDLSFTLFPGSFYFLTGASGAGKTSLLKLLYLAQRPSRGVVKMFGRDMITTPRSDLPAFRRRIGVVFQDFRLVEHMNAFDNVALPLRVAGVREADLKQPVTEMLSWVGLAHRVEAFPTTLSGGEQQRVAIARAVIGRPDILVADEPTGNVDPEMALKLMRMFEALNRLGTTVVVATHDVHLLKKVPESLIMRLDKGKLSDPTGALKYPPRSEKRSEKRSETSSDTSSERRSEVRSEQPAPKPRSKAAAPSDEGDDGPIDLGPGFKPRKPFGRGPQ